jgi:hypothetical protein
VDRSSTSATSPSVPAADVAGLQVKNLALAHSPSATWRTTRAAPSSSATTRAARDGLIGRSMR